MTKTAFVTGGTGFVGVNLVEQLTAAGWTVTALHRKTSNLKYLSRLPVTLAEGSITDPDALDRALPENVDAVFHVAANVSLTSRRNAGQTRDNVDGTRNMVAAALAKNAKRFIHTSSVAAFGIHDERVSEETPSNAGEVPINYFRTKAMAEEEVRKGIEHGLDAVIINPANILGPYDTRGWARLIHLVHDRKLPGIGPGGGSFCHVREVAKAHISAVETGGKGETYLLGGADASYLELVRMVAEIVGGKAPEKAISPGMMRLTGRIMPLLARLSGREPVVTPEIAMLSSRTIIVSSDKAMRELDFKAVPLREMVEDACKWMRAEGLISG
ncbi:MAG: SDR family oxidoreductase [Alphaproteobacteria bacterium]